MRVFFAAVAVLVLCSSLVAASSGKMTLLAVSDNNGVYTGSIATLSLQIEQGKGRVFIDTFPFSKLDTQISTRFAKEVACNFLDADCDNYDFFYTIEANSPIIGGPSAGGAITVLTAVLLDDLDYDKKIAMTGTINSGGVVGPVSGIKEKIEVASTNGVKTVLIPRGTAIYSLPLEFYNATNETKHNSTITNETFGNITVLNDTISLIDYGKTLGLKIIEVDDLNQALIEFTGKKFFDMQENISVDTKYSATMRKLAEDLCSRGNQLTPTIVENGTLSYDAYKRGVDFSQRAKNATKENQYYSAASYCFAANIQYRYATSLQENISDERARYLFVELDKDINALREKLDSLELNTITDLQAFVVTTERLNDAEQILNSSLNQFKENDTNYLYNLAFSTERLFSAVSWAQFFGKGGKNFDFNKKNLEAVCNAKLAEAWARFNYARLIVPDSLQTTEMDLFEVEKLRKNGEFASCLFQAAQAKAEANVVLSVIGVNSETFGEVLNTKMAVVQRVINGQIEKGVFPIVGYSYFEYASDLKESDKGSALLYLEYALELSDIDMYFPSKNLKSDKMDFDIPNWLMLVIGIILGFSIGISVARWKWKK